MTAVYNISANGVTDNKINAGVQAGLPQGVSLSANASAENSLTAARGNQVTLVFASSLCIPGQGTEAAKAAPVANDNPKAPAPGGKVTPIGATAQGHPLPVPGPLFMQPFQIKQLPPPQLQPK